MTDFHSLRTTYNQYSYNWCEQSWRESSPSHTWPSLLEHRDRCTHCKLCPHGISNFLGCKFPLGTRCHHLQHLLRSLPRRPQRHAGCIKKVPPSHIRSRVSFLQMWRMRSSSYPADITTSHQTSNGSWRYGIKSRLSHTVCSALLSNSIHRTCIEMS